MTFPIRRYLLRFALISAVITLAGLLTACDLESLAAFDNAATNDPYLQALLEKGPDVSNKVKQADKVVEQGLQDLHADLTPAMMLRPLDPRYRLLDTARLVALGESKETIRRNAADGMAVIARSNPGISEKDRERLFYEQFLNSLAEVATKAKLSDLELARVTRQYCATLAGYQKSFGGTHPNAAVCRG